MDTNLIELDNCKRELEATLDYQELLPHFEKALSDYKKNVTIPGFRKGGRLQADATTAGREVEKKESLQPGNRLKRLFEAPLTSSIDYPIFTLKFSSRSYSFL